MGNPSLKRPLALNWAWWLGALVVITGAMALSIALVWLLA